MTHYKQSLLEGLETATCYQDLLPLISILPFEAIQSSLDNYLQNDIKDEVIIKREYLNRMSIDKIIPRDAISNTLSYLPLITNY